MKKTITFALVIIMLFTMSVNSLADDYEVMPCFNNTITAATHFTIDENGLATVGLRYVGYQNCATSGTVTAKIQKKILTLWYDVPNASWEDQVEGFMYSTEYTFQLTSVGPYRLVYEYVVSGTGGADDVISGTLEDTYD